MGVLPFGPNSARIIYAEPVLRCTSPCAASEDREEAVRRYSAAADSQLAGLLPQHLSSPILCRHSVAFSNFTCHKSAAFCTVFGARAIFETIMADVSWPIGPSRNSP